MLFYFFCDFFQFLRNLLIEQISREKYFRQSICKYNFVFIFMFCNYHANIWINNRLNWNSVFFQIHKKLYYVQDFLHLVFNVVLIFAQLYFYDFAEITIQRHAKYSNLNHAKYSNLNANLLQKLTTMLYNCNFFIFLYKTANEFLQINSIFNNDLRIVLNSQMKLIMKTETDRRQINFLQMTKWS